MAGDKNPMAQWADIDVTAWEVIEEEFEGLRAKRWIASPDGTRWLRKHRRSSRSAEPAVERFALELAVASGLRAPAASAALWQARDSEPFCVVEKKKPPQQGSEPRRCADREAGRPCVGIIVEKFHGDDAQRSSGEDFIASLVEGYDRNSKRDRIHHNLPNIRTALGELERESPGATLLKDFAHLVTFDAWIGNSDRHQGNWAVIRKAGVLPQLAPVYDPASCLAVGLNDERREGFKRLLRDDSSLREYIAKCTSGFGDNIPQTEVLQQISEWPEWTINVSSWLARFKAALDTAVDPLLDSVPGHWLSPERRELMKRLLHARFTWLEQQTRQ